MLEFPNWRTVREALLGCAFLTRANLDLLKEEEARSKSIIADEQLVAEYYEYRKQLDQMAADFREVVTHPTYSLPFLQVGRLVKVKYEKLDFGWGVILNYQKRSPPKVCHLSLRVTLGLTSASEQTDTQT